jgi:hypothetical protein
LSNKKRWTINSPAHYAEYERALAAAVDETKVDRWGNYPVLVGAKRIALFMGISTDRLDTLRESGRYSSVIRLDRSGRLVADPMELWNERWCRVDDIKETRRQNRAGKKKNMGLKP